MSEVGSVKRQGSSTAKLSNAVLDQVKTYSEATGVPITRVLDDAVTFWMASVGAARMEVLTSPTADYEAKVSALRTMFKH